jgi:hypothetical protein
VSLPPSRFATPIQSVYVLTLIAAPSGISICTINRAMTPPLPNAVRLPTPLKTQLFEEGSQPRKVLLRILDFMQFSGQSVSRQEARRLSNDFQHILNSIEESQSQNLDHLDYGLVRLRDSMNISQEVAVQNDATCKFSYNELY